MKAEYWLIPAILSYLSICVSCAGTPQIERIAYSNAVAESNDLGMNIFYIFDDGAYNRFIFSSDYTSMTHIRKMSKDGETLFSLYYDFVAANTVVGYHGGESAIVLYGRLVNKADMIIIYIDESDGSVLYIYTHPYIVIGDPGTYFHDMSWIDDDNQYFTNWHAAQDRHYVFRITSAGSPPSEIGTVIRYNLTQTTPYVRDVVGIDTDSALLSMLQQDTTNYIHLTVIDFTNNLTTWSNQIDCTESYCDDYYFNIQAVLVNSDANACVHFTKTAGSIEVFNLAVADGNFDNHYTLTSGTYSIVFRAASAQNNTAINVVAYDSTAQVSVIIVYDITTPTIETAYYLSSPIELTYYGTLENDQIQFFTGSLTENGVQYGFYGAFTEGSSAIYDELFLAETVTITDDATGGYTYAAYTPADLDYIEMVLKLTDIADHDVIALVLDETITTPTDTDDSYIVSITAATGDVTANLGNECTNGTYTVANYRAYPAVSTYFTYTYVLDVSATMSDGSAIPSWMSVEATTGVITYTYSVAGSYQMNITINYITPENTISSDSVVTMVFSTIAGACVKTSTSSSSSSGIGKPSYSSNSIVGIILVTIIGVGTVATILIIYWRCTRKPKPPKVKNDYKPKPKKMKKSSEEELKEDGEKTKDNLKTERGLKEDDLVITDVEKA